MTLMGIQLAHGQRPATAPTTAASPAVVEQVQAAIIAYATAFDLNDEKAMRAAVRGAADDIDLAVVGMQVEAAQRRASKTMRAKFNPPGSSVEIPNPRTQYFQNVFKEPTVTYLQSGNNVTVLRNDRRFLAVRQDPDGWHVFHTSEDRENIPVERLREEFKRAMAAFTDVQKRLESGDIKSVTEFNAAMRDARVRNPDRPPGPTTTGR